MNAVALLHDVGMPSLWVCGVFLVLVLVLLGIVVRAVIRHGTAEGARYAVPYLALCLASFVYMCFDDGANAQTLALFLTLPLSFLLTKSRDVSGVIPVLIFFSLANAAAFLILFGVVTNKMRAGVAADGGRRLRSRKY